MININDGAGTNVARICGEVRSEAILSHTTYGETFYTFTASVARNSGYEDQLTIMASERILSAVEIRVGCWVDIQGQIRTYNEEVSGHNRLNIVVFAQDILIATGEADEPDVWTVENPDSVNEIYLEGYLCKKPLQRTSPLGRKISDLMLAVNRMYNKSDYIPCIAWGRNAVYSGTLEVGAKVSVHGRLQSREYRKRQDDGSVEIKTAYEVSVLQLEIFDTDVL